jgi:hypothetical protein
VFGVANTVGDEVTGALPRIRSGGLACLVFGAEDTGQTPLSIRESTRAKGRKWQGKPVPYMVLARLAVEGGIRNRASECGVSVRLASEVHVGVIGHGRRLGVVGRCWR